MYKESVNSDRLALILSGLEQYYSVSEACQDLDRRKATALRNTDEKGYALPNFELNAFERRCDKAATLQTELMELLQQAFWFPTSYEPIRVSDARCSLDTEQDYWNLVADREGLAQYFLKNGDVENAELIDKDARTKIKTQESPDERKMRLFKEYKSRKLRNEKGVVDGMAERENCSGSRIRLIISTLVEDYNLKSATPLHPYSKKVKK